MSYFCKPCTGSDCDDPSSVRNATDCITPNNSFVLESELPPARSISRVIASRVNFSEERGDCCLKCFTMHDMRGSGLLKYGEEDDAVLGSKGASSSAGPNLIIRPNPPYPPFSSAYRICGVGGHAAMQERLNGGPVTRASLGTGIPLTPWNGIPMLPTLSMPLSSLHEHCFPGQRVVMRGIEELYDSKTWFANVSSPTVLEYELWLNANINHLRALCGRPPAQPSRTLFLKAQWNLEQRQNLCRDGLGYVRLAGTSYTEPWDPMTSCIEHYEMHSNYLQAGEACIRPYANVSYRIEGLTPALGIQAGGFVANPLHGLIEAIYRIAFGLPGQSPGALVGGSTLLVKLLEHPSFGYVFGPGPTVDILFSGNPGKQIVPP